MADEPIQVDASSSLAAQMQRRFADLFFPKSKPVPIDIQSNVGIGSPVQKSALDVSGDTEEKCGYDGPYYPYFGATSFAELEELQASRRTTRAVEELTYQFQQLTSNIMSDAAEVDKVGAVERLTREFTQKLRTIQNPAVQDGLLKEADEEPVEETPLLVIDKEVATKQGGGLMIWKDAQTGLYRWLAIYSNNFRDADNPPEIISEKSHRAFIELVEEGVVPYPELWHYHVPGTAWGVADWLDYADGFALASGTVYPGHEKEAEAVAALSDVRVSHGMPSRFIVRNSDDPTVIDFAITTEISDLPGHAAANPLTEFFVFDTKEQDDMALTPQRRAYLQQVGLTEDQIKGLETSIESKSQTALVHGIESKEATPTAAAVDAPAAPAAVTAVVETSTPPVVETAPVVETVNAVEAVAADAPRFVTAEEVVAAVGELIKPLVEALQTVTQSQVALAAEVKSLQQTDEEKVAAKAAATPRASLAELMTNNIFGTPVDGRSTLAKSGPKETEAPAQAVVGIPIIDSLIAQNQAYGKPQ